MTALPTAKLIPKSDIELPGQYEFIFKCNGGAIPNDGGSSSSPLLAKWVDNSVDLQVDATGITYPTTIDTTAKAFGTAPILTKKLFNSQGFEAYYTFRIRSSVALNEFSRVYIEFSSGIDPNLNREGDLECYQRLAYDDLV